MTAPLKLERRGRAWPLPSLVGVVLAAMWLGIGFLIGVTLNCGGSR